MTRLKDVPLPLSNEVYITSMIGYMWDRIEADHKEDLDQWSVREACHDILTDVLTQYYCMIWLDSSKQDIEDKGDVDIRVFLRRLTAEVLSRMRGNMWDIAVKKPGYSALSVDKRWEDWTSTVRQLPETWCLVVGAFPLSHWHPQYLDWEKLVEIIERKWEAYSKPATFKPYPPSSIRVKRDMGAIYVFCLRMQEVEKLCLIASSQKKV